MIRKRILSLLVCAACCAACWQAAAPLPAALPLPALPLLQARALPSSTVTADTGKVGPLDAGENSLFSLSDPDDAFAPCLGWGPGVSGCSLKSVIAAASLLKWPMAAT